MGVVEAVTDLTKLNEARLKMEAVTRRLGELNRLEGIIAKSQAIHSIGERKDWWNTSSGRIIN